MLIIRYVEICSKPMAILLYDFCVCVFTMSVLACHSGSLEGYYFSMMICMLFVWKKIKVTSETGWVGRSTGGRGGGGVASGENRKV